jgi:hypothetical protein
MRDVQDFNWERAMEFRRPMEQDAAFHGRVWMHEATAKDAPSGLYVIEGLFALCADDRRGGPATLEVAIPGKETRVRRVDIRKDADTFTVNMFHRHHGGDLNVDIICTPYGYISTVLGTNSGGNTAIVINHAFG